MGFLYRGVCYPSQSLVRSEYCASSRDAVTSGGSLVSHSCSVPMDFNASQAAMSVYTNGTLSGTYAAPWPPDVSCSFDGSMSSNVEMFSLMLGFLLVVFLARTLMQLFWPKNHEL